MIDFIYLFIFLIFFIQGIYNEFWKQYFLSYYSLHWEMFKPASPRPGLQIRLLNRKSFPTSSLTHQLHQQQLLELKQIKNKKTEVLMQRESDTIVYTNVCVCVCLCTHV